MDNTGHYIQYPAITYNGIESESIYLYNFSVHLKLTYSNKIKIYPYLKLSVSTVRVNTTGNKIFFPRMLNRLLNQNLFFPTYYKISNTVSTETIVLVVLYLLRGISQTLDIIFKIKIEEVLV